MVEDKGLEKKLGWKDVAKVIFIPGGSFIYGYRDAKARAQARKPSREPLTESEKYAGLMRMDLLGMGCFEVEKIAAYMALGLVAYEMTR